MKKNKLILFDWGHVIQNGDSKKFTIEEARKKVCDDMNPIEYNSLLEIFDLNEFWILNGVGFEKFITNKLIETGSNLNFGDFKKLYLHYNHSVPYFEETIELINNLLNEDCCYIGLFSNISEFDVIQLREHLNLSKFDYLFLSTQLEMQKPNDDIYKNVLEKTNLLPANILFIDDRIENIKVANKYGWNTCLATGNEIDKIKNEIVSFLKIKESNINERQ